MTVQHRHLVARLQLHDYTFWEEKPRQKVFRGPNGHLVFVRKAKRMKEESVRTTLYQIGRPRDEVEAFIVEYGEDS